MVARFFQATYPKPTPAEIAKRIGNVPVAADTTVAAPPVASPAMITADAATERPETPKSNRLYPILKSNSLDCSFRQCFRHSSKPFKKGGNFALEDIFSLESNFFKS